MILLSNRKKNKQNTFNIQPHGGDTNAILQVGSVPKDCCKYACYNLCYLIYINRLYEKKSVP